MYEIDKRSGLGEWGGVSWWAAMYSGGCNCGWSGGMVDSGNRTNTVCFDESPESLALANRHGCTRARFAVDARQARCDLPSGRQGYCWCCPPGYPRDHEDVSSLSPEERLYNEQQQGLIDTPPVPPVPETTLPELPTNNNSSPAPFHRMSLMQKLLHPGSIAAISVIGVAAFLVKKELERR